MLCISFFILFPTQSFFSQSFIQAGNRWDYIEGYRLWGDEDTTSYFASADTVLPNGKTYNKIIPWNSLFQDFIRADSSGVWYYSSACADELLFYSFTDSIGHIRTMGCDSIFWIGTITKIADTVDVVFQDTVRVFTYRYQVYPAQPEIFTISPQLGFISQSGPFLYSKSLMGCIISDTLHGTLLVAAEDQPEKFIYQLAQNYPNPFNPSTTIEYSIPEYSSVIIKIFDILGNEIETLVNEEKPSGTYKYIWNAEGLPSGVYFCRMQAGGYVQIRKMILMR